MWLALINLIGGPVVSGLIKAYQAHLTAVNSSEATAADLAGKEIAAQTLETQSINALKIAEIGHAFEPEKLAFYIVLVFFAKCVIWDTVLGLGTTPALKGDVSIWGGMVMGFYFSKRTAENVFRILKRG
jgi:hypothetical protein